VRQGRTGSQRFARPGTNEQQVNKGRGYQKQQKKGEEKKNSFRKFTSWSRISNDLEDCPEGGFRKRESTPESDSVKDWFYRPWESKRGKRGLKEETSIGP